MASLSRLGQNPSSRDGFYTLVLHLCYFCLVMDCQIRSRHFIFPNSFLLCNRCIVISVLNTTALHTPKYTTAEQEQMDGKINL